MVKVTQPVDDQGSSSLVQLEAGVDGPEPIKTDLSDFKKDLKESLGLKNIVNELISSIKRLTSRRDATKIRTSKLKKGKIISQNAAQRGNMNEKLKHMECK